MFKVLVHYGEIGIKGKNISDFEIRCVKNIKLSAKKNNLKINNIIRKEKRILIDFNSNDKELIIKTLEPIFGIKNFSFIREVKKDIKSILEEGKKELEKLKKEGFKVISFKTKRGDKSFPLKSPEINNELRFIAEKELGLEVNYKNSEITLFIEILFKECFIYSSKIKGLGGLPVGSTGRVLCLLSGGIDSPVAAYNMMKRGTSVDFIHIHNFINNEFAIKSRLKKTIEILNNYQFQSRIYLIPYSIFEFETMNKNFNSRYSVILFKNYILKLANEIAKEYNYDAIITGDNLAQVASQTMENLEVTSYNIEKLIFRPLLTYDKEEIIILAKKIGTFEESIKEYKDCCSLVAKNPITKAKLDKFKEVLEIINLEELINNSKIKIESFLVK